MTRICKIAVYSIFIFLNILNANSQTENLLMQVYAQNNSSLLDTYLNKWVAKENVAISNDSLYIEVQAIYALTYQPAQISRIVPLSQWDSLYHNTKYFIVKQGIKAYTVVSDSLRKQGHPSDSINQEIILDNFLPQIHFEHKKIIYLDSNLRQSITSFLSNSKETEKRNAFLGKSLKIVPLKQGQWYIETQPVINTIYFNRSKRMARADFTIFDTQGSVFYIKENGAWRMIWSGFSE